MAVPSLSGAKSDSRRSSNLGSLDERGLVRLKGIIFLGRKCGKEEVELGLMIVFMPQHCHGSDHLADFTRAIDVFQGLGGGKVAKACSDPDES